MPKEVLYLAVVALVVIGIVIYIVKKRKPLKTTIASQPEIIFSRIKKDAKFASSRIEIHGNQSIIVFRKGEFYKEIETSELDVKEFMKKEKHDNNLFDLEKYDFYIYNHVLENSIDVSSRALKTVFDNKFNLILEFQFSGEYVLEVKDIDSFFEWNVLFEDQYTYSDLLSTVGAEVVNRIQNIICESMIDDKISILTANYYLSQIETVILDNINQIFDDRGIQMIELSLSSIELAETDALKKLDTLLVNRLKLNIPGYSYVIEKKAEFINKIGIENAMKNRWTKGM